MKCFCAAYEWDGKLLCNFGPGVLCALGLTAGDAKAP